MKKTVTMILCIVLVLSLIGCKTKTEQTDKPSADLQSETENNNDSIHSFSYVEDCAIYVDGEPGVKTSGFVNTAETDVNRDNVTIIAKQECNIEYNSTAVSYDSDAEIWRVEFGTEGMAGGCLTVYLDNSGRTVRVVQGE